MSRLAFADDAVSIRRARVRGMAEGALRRELAIIPTPAVRRFVFVRRVTLRGAPEQIGQTFKVALSQLARDGRDDVLTFADFPALAVACAREALGGGLGGWWWRTLGLPAAAAPGEAVAALLTAYPLEAGSAVAALAERGLLASVWRSMPDAAAAGLIGSLAQAAGFDPPAWPDTDASPTPGPAASAEAALLRRAAAAWREALAPLGPRSEAVRAAAVLALMRWAPTLLRTSQPRLWPALLAHLTGEAPAAAPQAPIGSPTTPPEPNQPAEPRPAASRSRAGTETHSPPIDGPTPAAAADQPGAPLAEDTISAPHGLEIATGWAGVLMLINALPRLEIEALLTGPEAPTGWRVLHDLGIGFGMPEDEPLAVFLAAQDLDTTLAPPLLGELMRRLEALYRPDGPWPLPLAQAGLLRATETHLDLEFATTEIDLATRLAGLDFNPGWTPWLGRVVAFHYNLPPTIVREGA